MSGTTILLYTMLHVSTFQMVIFRSSKRSNQQMLCTRWDPSMYTLIINIKSSKSVTYSGVPRGVRGGWTPPKPSLGTPSEFRRPSKIVPNSTRLWKLLKIAEFRTPTPQDVRKKGTKILKPRPVRNCFTLTMTNKLVVIINSFKVPKIKKILIYEMKFLVPNYSCLQNPWLGGYCHQIRVLCPRLSTEFVDPPPRTKFLGTPLVT